MKYIPLFEGEIYEKQCAIERMNQQIIDNYQNLSWFGKIIDGEKSKQKIIENSQTFSVWQNRRMIEMQNE